MLRIIDCVGNNYQRKALELLEFTLTLVPGIKIRGVSPNPLKEKEKWNSSSTL